MQGTGQGTAAREDVRGGCCWGAIDPSWLGGMTKAGGAFVAGIIILVQGLESNRGCAEASLIGGGFGLALPCHLRTLTQTRPAHWPPPLSSRIRTRTCELRVHLRPGSAIQNNVKGVVMKRRSQ